jgi:hypothetical protein
MLPANWSASSALTMYERFSTDFLSGNFHSLYGSSAETGMERATSSLGIWTSIESKEQWRAMASTRASKPLQFSVSEFACSLMGCNLRRLRAVLQELFHFSKKTREDTQETATYFRSSAFSGCAQSRPSTWHVKPPPVRPNQAGNGRAFRARVSRRRSNQRRTLQHLRG